MAKKRNGRTEKIKLRKIEILSNKEARERIRGRVVCIVYDVPSMFDEEDTPLSDNILALIKENGKHKIIVIPNEDFRNAILFENIPQKIVKGLKNEEKIQSDFSLVMWSGASDLSMMTKRLPHNMYV